MSTLTDIERATLLNPCDCSHTINDHGTLIGCWRCEDDGKECVIRFDDLLVTRVATIVDTRTAAAAARPEGESRPLGWLFAKCEGDGPHAGRPEYVHGRVLCPACAEDGP